MNPTGTVPLVDLAEQHSRIAREVEESVLEVLRSGRYTGGPVVEQFEQEFAAYCGTAHTVSVNSGTAALHAALLALDIGAGDEVITVSNTFVATVEAIVAVGARPVFVDVYADDHTMEPGLLEPAITPRTKAIIPVHLYGQMTDMDPILDIARRHGVAVIEDASQAQGAAYNGHRAGSMGDIGCFSFYPSKNLGSAGEAGACVTSSGSLAVELRRVRDHGQTERYHHGTFGLNFRLPAIQAAVLSVKLRYLEEWNDLRRAHAATYQTLLSGSDLILPLERSGNRHVYYVYVIRSVDRDELATHLSDHGVGTGIHYPIPVHLQPPYEMYGQGPGSLPHTEELAASILSLPIYPEMTERQLEYVAGAVRAFAAPVATMP